MSSVVQQVCLSLHSLVFCFVIFATFNSVKPFLSGCVFLHACSPQCQNRAKVQWLSVRTHKTRILCWDASQLSIEARRQREATSWISTSPRTNWAFVERVLRHPISSNFKANLLTSSRNRIFQHMFLLQKGDTALHISVRSRYAGLCEVLLRDQKNSRLLYKPNKSGDTPYSIDRANKQSVLSPIFGNRK